VTGSSNLNGIQQLCTDLSAQEPELVLEPLYGIRQWTVGDPRYRDSLTGHFQYRWHLSEERYTATCDRQRRYVQTRAEALNLTREQVSSVQLVEELAFQLTRGKFFPEERANAGLSHLSVRASGVYPGKDPAELRSYVFRPGYTNSLHVHGPNAYDQIELSLKSALTTTLHELLMLSHDSYAVVVEFSTYELWNHRPADPACTCGFYAYHTRHGLVNNMAEGFGLNVFGLVRATGHATLGTDGLRAEHCEIVALTPALLAPSGRLDTWTHPLLDQNANARRYLRAAHRWGKRVVPDLDALMALAAEHGIMVDPLESPKLRSDDRG